MSPTHHLDPTPLATMSTKIQHYATAALDTAAHAFLELYGYSDAQRRWGRGGIALEDALAWVGASPRWYEATMADPSLPSRSRVHHDPAWRFSDGSAVLLLQDNWEVVLPDGRDGAGELTWRDAGVRWADEDVYDGSPSLLLDRVDDPEDMWATDLVAEAKGLTAAGVEWEAYRVQAYERDDRPCASRGLLLWVPEVGRAGIAYDGDAQWTDADAPGDALMRWDLGAMCE